MPEVEYPMTRPRIDIEFVPKDVNLSSINWYLSPKVWS